MHSIFLTPHDSEPYSIQEQRSDIEKNHDQEEYEQDTSEFVFQVTGWHVSILQQKVDLNTPVPYNVLTNNTLKTT